MRIVDASISSYVKKIIENEKDIQIVSSADNLNILLDYVEFDDPDVVIISKEIDTEPSGENLLKNIKKIRQIKPLIRFVVLVPKYNKDFFQRLVNLGIFSIIIYEDIKDNFVKEIRNPKTKFSFEDYEIKPQKREYIDKVTKGFKRVIAVYSASPTGKSFIASNLAYITARKGIKTALVDGDMKNRALSYYFYIEDALKRNAMKEIMEGERLHSIEELGYTLADGNLKVYTSQRYNDDLNEIQVRNNKERFLELLDHLRSENEIVFIDTNKDIDNELTKTSLSFADTILLVQNLDYRMMEANKVALRKLSSMYISLRKLVLVINNYIENKELNEKSIEKYFDIKFAGRVCIPQDTLAAVKNISYGKPAVATKDCNEATLEAFYNLSQFCYGIERIEKRKGGFLSKLLG